MCENLLDCDYTSELINEVISYDLSQAHYEWRKVSLVLDECGRGNVEE